MLATRTGLQAKYLSKTIREKVQLRALWNEERRSVMDYLIAIKFRDRRLCKLLLDTQQSPLKECVRSREGFWSMVTYTGQPGQNVLGQILMERREFSRKKPDSSQNMPRRIARPDTAVYIGMCAISTTVAPGQIRKARCGERAVI